MCASGVEERLNSKQIFETLEFLVVMEALWIDEVALGMYNR